MQREARIAPMETFKWGMTFTVKDSSRIPNALRQACAATTRDMLFHVFSSTRKSLAWDGNVVCFFKLFLTPSEGMKWKQPSNKCIISKMHFQFIFMFLCTPLHLTLKPQVEIIKIKKTSRGVILNSTGAFYSNRFTVDFAGMGKKQ